MIHAASIERQATSRPAGGVGDQNNTRSTGARSSDSHTHLSPGGPCTFSHDGYTITIVRGTAIVERDGVPADDDEAERVVMEAFAQ